MTFITPKELKPNDTILVAASAGVVDPDAFNTALAGLDDRFNFSVPDSIFRAERYLAGSDEIRANELNQAFRDPTVRGIWIARGGYGISRILPYLDVGAFLSDPIPIIGYSDVTALHAWALAQGVKTIHAPVLQNMSAVEPKDVTWLRDLLKGEGDGVMMDNGQPGDIPLEGEALLVGGNLSLIAHLIGTPYQIKTKDSFLAIEDIGEEPYAIDRYLTQLGAAGVFDDCLGVVVGEFTKCGDCSDDVKSTIRERLLAFNMPSLWGAPFGHGRRNRAFSVGGRVSVNGETLRLVEPAVSPS